MAGFTLRIQFNGSILLNELSSESSIAELKQKISSILNMDRDEFIILTGYPPQPLVLAETSSLAAAGINSGEVLIIRHVVPVIKPVPLALQLPAVPVVDAMAAGDLSATNERAFQSISGVMLRRIVPSDNSCMFMSFDLVISNDNANPERSNLLRYKIAEVVAQNPERYTEAFLSMTNEEYCVWITHPDHWGGAIELAILSELYFLEICAIDVGSLVVHRFGETSNYVNRIFLIYDGIHYDPMVLETGNGTIQTMFAVSDEMAMNMAIEVARECRLSRQFTDVANFSIRCFTCGMIFRGDKEARRHAIETGHVNFGEI